MKTKPNLKLAFLYFSKPKGFALISTIMIMSLLMLIAVAMMSFSAIETRTSRFSNAQFEAEQNAKLALTLAIAKLQLTAGQDQRITYTADMAGKVDGTKLAAGADPGNNVSYDGQSKKLSMLQNGTRYWTAVGRNLETDPSATIYTKTPSSEQIAWLVSGENPQPSDAELALDAQGLPTDEAKVAILVGENTVGLSGSNGSTGVSNFVSAPMVELEEKGKVTGRYAWWVGDEGVKARTNVRADYKKDDKADYEDLVANRSSWEKIPGFESYPIPGSDKDFDKIIGDGELELIETSLRGKPLHSAFHSGTSYSVGLATDSLNGGLKVDLSYYLENGFASSANFSGEPVSNENIIPKTIAPNIKGPTWKQLADFYKVGKDLGSGSKELIVQAGNDSGNTVTIAPVLSDIRVLFGALPKRHSGNIYQIFATTKVAVSIANPYPYPLRWKQPLEFELSSDTPAGIRPSCIWDIGSYCQFLPQYTSSPACLNNAVMRIPSDVLAPGEARSYTIGSKVERSWGTARVNIDMVPFNNTDPTNYEYCIVQKNNVGFDLTSGSVRLDVRESTNTTQMMAELRLANTSSGLLRRVKSFELDNGYFVQTTRWLNSYWASRMTKPFGLQLFTFQISQPGADYGSYLAHPSYLGIAGSTIRTFADFNVRASHFKAPITSYNPPPYFGKSENSFAQIPYTAPGGNTGIAFTRNLAIDPLPWGQSPFGPQKTVLFSFPEQILSLAQFQHADLTADDSRVSVADQPGNAFANSYAPPLVKRHLSSEERTDYKIFNQQNATPSQHRYYDISYMLNASLWDRYFLSSIPASGDSTPVNPKIAALYSQVESDLRNPQKAAASVGIKGAFNVNSTNKQAWVALLSSTRHLKHPADGAGDTSGAFFPRSLEQVEASSEEPSGTDDDSWGGYRRLTDAEIDTLADHIVKQVRTRGPFTSLAHFTNRTLIPLKENAELGRSGPLQAAIDNAALTVTPDRSSSAFKDLDLNEDKVNFQRIGNYPRADIEGGKSTRISNPGPDYLWAPRSADLNPGSIASILSDRPMLIDNNLRDEQGSRSTGIPGWLTQADVLQVIGSAISVRSDTFRIRAYGESVDSGTGQVQAKVWCEAIVQRNPNYVDPTNTAEADPDTITEMNKKYGRKFNIISFRWLNRNEI